MKLANPFPLRVRVLFLYCYACFRCKRSDKGLELHHIVGRKSASAFNAIPICPPCHATMGHGREEEYENHQLTQDFLISERYVPIEEDWEFLREFPHLVGH